MKKLGKKRTGNNNTDQAYACGGAFCVCKACAAASVDSMLYNGTKSQNDGTLMLIGQFVCQEVECTRDC